MDPTRFDTLVAALARPASRRATVASLLGGAVGALGRSAAAADPKGDAHAAKGGSCPSGKKPCHGHCINKRRSCHKPGEGCKDNGQPCKKNGQCCSNRCDNHVCAAQLGCLPTGDICAQNSDCCSANCFNFVCAARVTECGTGGSARQCVPPAKGCAGGACCYGEAACGGSCCQGAANQCNPQGACCAPNCNGRECGDDGCGAGGTCGSCPTGQTCNATTGQCVITCGPQNCSSGCCDANGKCKDGTSAQACGAGGSACVACPSEQTCLAGACQNKAGTCTGSVKTCGQNTHSPCNNTNACTCDVALDGATVCRVFNGVACSDCESNADCGPGAVCLRCAHCPQQRPNACATLC